MFDKSVHCTIKCANFIQNWNAQLHLASIRHEHGDFVHQKQGIWKPDSTRKTKVRMDTCHHNGKYMQLWNHWSKRISGHPRHLHFSFICTFFHYTDRNLHCTSRPGRRPIFGFRCSYRICHQLGRLTIPLHTLQQGKYPNIAGGQTRLMETGCTRRIAHWSRRLQFLPIPHKR